MAKKLKTNIKQTQTIREAFADFFLTEKSFGACGQNHRNLFPYAFRPLPPSAKCFTAKQEIFWNTRRINLIPQSL